MRYNGKMTDSNFYAFPAEVVTLDAFTLVNLGFDWQFTGKVQFYGRVENLLNEGLRRGLHVSRRRPCGLRGRAPEILIAAPFA